MPDMEKVIKDAEEAIEILRNVDEPTPWCDFVRVSVERALELLKEPTVSNWVSVKDRLPEEKENPLTHDFAEVICFCDFGGRPKRTDIRTYKFGKRCDENEPHFWYGPQIMDRVVTHWMPLPPKLEMS